MKVSIQVGQFNVWSDNQPVIHKVGSWKEAVKLAYAISHQLNYTVRLVEIPTNCTHIDLDYIGRISGTYIKSQESLKFFFKDVNTII